MKASLRKLFSPILNHFESGDEAFSYKASHRKVLMFMGVLFLVLSGVSAVATVVSGQIGGLVPFLVFFVVGLVCEVVGFLGNDRAVAKIWGDR